VDYLAVCSVALSGAVVAARRVGLDTAREPIATVVNPVADLVEQVVETSRDEGRGILGLTVGVPGLVTMEAGEVVTAPNLGWRGVPIVDLVRTALTETAVTVQADNEANLAALAEYDARRRRVSDLVLLTGDVGVGAGLVIDGRLHRGHFGFGGEVGHMPLEIQGAQCGCGRRGCWETRVGLTALLNGLADLHDDVLDPTLDVEQRLREVVRRAEAGSRARSRPSSRSARGSASGPRRWSASSTRDWSFSADTSPPSDHGCSTRCDVSSGPARSATTEPRPRSRCRRSVSARRFEELRR